MNDRWEELLLSAWPILALVVFLVAMSAWFGRKNRPFIDMQRRQVELLEKLLEQNERLTRAVERLAQRASSDDGRR